MEKAEGPVTEIRNWTDGTGADVILHQDPTRYFFHGKMPIVPGPVYQFEVIDGEGEHQGEKEIISARRPRENRVPSSLTGQGPPKPGQVQPQPPPGMKMIQLPMADFNALTRQAVLASESKFRSLDAAVKTYTAMSKTEKDPKAAVQEVVLIATELEGFLV